MSLNRLGKQQSYIGGNKPKSGVTQKWQPERGNPKGETKRGNPKGATQKGQLKSVATQKYEYRLRVVAVPSQSKFLSIYDEQNLLWEELEV